MWAGIQMQKDKPHSFLSPPRLTFDCLRNLQPPTKTRNMSIICSGLRNWPGHKLRYALVERLKREFHGEIDFFGYDSSPLPDKWDGLAPYKYHICIENSSLPNYWTEKIADPFLAYSVPIYYGCTNLSGYFPPSSFIGINIERPDEAINMIGTILKRDTYSERLSHLTEARRLILEKYNFFPHIAKICSSQASSYTKIRLLPESSFTNSTLRQRLLRRTRSFASILKPKPLPSDRC